MAGTLGPERGHDAASYSLFRRDQTHGSRRAHREPLSMVVTKVNPLLQIEANPQAFHACTERPEAWPGHSFGSLVLSARSWVRVRQAGCAVLAPLVAGDSSLFPCDDLLRLHIATLPLPSAFWHGSSVRETDKGRCKRSFESQSPRRQGLDPGLPFGRPDARPSAEASAAGPS